MTAGWVKDGAIQEQIDASIDSEVSRVRSLMPRGVSLLICEDCEESIPEKRRLAVPGVRLCVQCQTEADRTNVNRSLYNRSGSMDSQLK